MIPAGVADLDAYGAQFAKEGTRFDIAGDKLPPHPVKRRPATGHNKMNIAVVGRPTDNPGARRLEPSAMAIKNPTGIWIKRFETGVCRKQVYDRHRAADDDPDGGGGWPLRQAVTTALGLHKWGGRRYKNGPLFAGPRCISLGCDGDHSPSPRDRTFCATLGWCFRPLEPKRRSDRQGAIFHPGYNPAPPRLGAGREARPPR